MTKLQRVQAHLMVWVFLAHVVLAVVAVVLRRWLIASGSLGVSALLGWAIMRNTANGVQGLGRWYWIARDNGRGAHWIKLNWLKETDPPWREGRGVEVRVSRSWTFQLGRCRFADHDDLVDVLGEWEDAATPEVIREWT